ncbi:MAG TPA: HEAT repeat domain-containing protein [Polyangiaceae bacterium]|nr:HEAT repeat domain-containing protein [Polyangiaceae bacterium]
MGFFDFFKRSSKDDAPEEELADKKIASLGKKASDKRSQAYDRDEAIRALIGIGTHEAAVALMKRFKLQVDPSITDQEEKQLAFEGIVSIGRGERGKRVSDAGKDAKEISDDPLTPDEVAELRDAVVAGAKEYCERAENLTWPLKVMRALLDDAAYEKELLELLNRHDTEYTRNVEPKVNLLAAMEEVKTEAIRKAVEEYLDDVNETVRFHAVQTIFDQGDPSSMPALVKMCEQEESVRIKNKVAEGMIEHGWSAPEDLVETFQAAMKDAYEYRVDDDGSVHKA